MHILSELWDHMGPYPGAVTADEEDGVHGTREKRFSRGAFWDSRGAPSLLGIHAVPEFTRLLLK